MKNTAVTVAKKRVLELLKRSGYRSAPEIADGLDLTDVAVRQHLGSLESAGFVVQRPKAASGRGRPGVEWSLTDEAVALFPDRHAELTIGLIDAIRQTVGEEGLHRIVEARARDQLTLYRQLLPGLSASLKKRIESLAARRTQEGYMAEVLQEQPGVYILIEHHCPICDAAKTCQGICRGELKMFRKVLGSDIEVERTAHLLSGGDRCAYRIQKKKKRKR